MSVKKAAQELDFSESTIRNLMQEDEERLAQDKTAKRKFPWGRILSGEGVSTTYMIDGNALLEFKERWLEDIQNVFATETYISTLMYPKNEDKIANAQEGEQK